MNALAAAIPNQSLTALAFLNGTIVPSLPKAVQTGTAVTPGFTDLINALFGSVATPGNAAQKLAAEPPKTPKTQTQAQIQVPSQPDAPAQPTLASTPPGVSATLSLVPNDPQQNEFATPSQAPVPLVPALITSDANIAQAMIQAMLGSPRPTTSSPATAVTGDNKTSDLKTSPKAAKAIDKAAGKTMAAFSLTPVATPVTVPFVTEPLPQHPASITNAPAKNIPSDGFSQSLLKNPDLQITTTSVAQPISNAPVSFAAKLTPLATPPLATPVETPVEPVPDEIQEASSDPVTDSGSAPAPQLPAHGRDTRIPDAPEKDEPVAPVAMAAAASSYSGGFTHSFQDASSQNGTPAIAADTKTPTTFGTVAESMRSSESIAIANTQPAPAQNNSPVQSITMRINHPDMPQVDLQVTTRGGEIHVAVRTPDAQLESALRQDLGTLTNSLDRAGYRTETYIPRDTVREAGHEIGFTAAQSPSSGSQENRESSHEQQNFTGRDSGGSHSGRQQQQQGRQNQGNPQRFRNWIFEMEKQ